MRYCTCRYSRADQRETRIAPLMKSDAWNIDRLALAVVVTVVAIRVLLAFFTPAPAIEADSLGYDASARRLIEQGYFAHVIPGTETPHPGPDANTLPGYAVFLAALLLLTGDAAATPLLVSVAQAALSGATLWGIYSLGKRLIGARGGLVAVLIGAAYVPFWWSYRYVLTEDLFMALSVGAMATLMWALDANGPMMWRRSVVFGVLGAAAVYVRAAAGPWMIIGFAVLLVTQRQRWREVVIAGVLAALTVVACLSPWWIRNATIYDRFVPLNVRVPYGSFIATFDDWGDLTEPGRHWSANRLSPKQQLAEDERIAELTRNRNREQLASDPVEAIWRRVRATLISITTYHPNPFGGFRGLGGVVEVVHLTILVMAVRGLWLTRQRWETWLLASYPAAMVLTYGLILIFSRHLFPSMPFVIVLAAAGVVGAGRPDDGES